MKIHTLGCKEDEKVSLCNQSNISDNNLKGKNG